jgi:hypothetical protein
MNKNLLLFFIDNQKIKLDKGLCNYEYLVVNKNISTY